MKRSDLVRHLRAHGCELLREGGRYSWWHNPALNKRSALPRHSEISDNLGQEDLQRLGNPDSEMSLAFEQAQADPEARKHNFHPINACNEISRPSLL